MPSQEGAPPQIYIPALHRELIGRPLPDGVLLVDPGLPRTGGSASRLYTPCNYPLSENEAARALAELLSIGEALDLSSPKNADLARAALPANVFAPEERRDLARFASRASDETPGAPSPLIAAQKVLLLAWDLEARLVEIGALRREIERTALPLAEALRDPSSGPPSSGSVSGFLPGIPDNAEPDWRPVLAAMAAFLPEEALFVTFHENMRNTLLELGMLLPLPEDTAQKLSNWPDSLKTAMLWAKAPLWRILGHPKPPENAPWLSKAPEIIACSPEKKRPA